MANTNRPKGFKPKNIKTAETNRYVITAGETTKDGDVLYLASTGLLSGSAAAGPVVGVQNGAIIDETDGLVNATAVAGDIVSVWDNPNEVFVGQISTYTLTDPYTTRATAACYDVGGSAGAQYIDAAASTYDIWKVVRPAYEESGVRSAVGAYAKVECRFNPGKHAYGPG